jgi:hypothetical protein
MGKKLLPSILDLLRSQSPHKTTVTGQPPTPSEQGSVERANRTIKEMLYGFERQQWLKGDTPNWTKRVSFCAASMKCKEIHGVECVLLYQAVFNMPYKETKMAIPSDLYSRSAAYEQLNLMKNSNFANMVRLNRWEHKFELPEESNKDDLVEQYWSDLDSVSLTEGTFLTGDRTLANLQLEVADKAGTPKGGTDARSKLSKVLEVPVSVAMGTTGTKRSPRKPRIFTKKLPRVQPQFVKRANWLPRLLRVPTASTSSSLQLIVSKELPPIKLKRLITVSKAHKHHYSKTHTAQDSKTWNWMHTELLCTQRCHTRSNNVSISIVESKHLQQLEKWKDYFDHVFLHGMVQLLNHAHHKQDKQTVQYVSCTYLPEVELRDLVEEEVVSVREGITALVSLIHRSSHSVVVAVDLLLKHVSVFDGLNVYKNSHSTISWGPYAIFLLKRAKKKTITKKEKKTMKTTRMKRMTMTTTRTTTREMRMTTTRTATTVTVTIPNLRKAKKVEYQQGLNQRNPKEYSDGIKVDE